MSTETAEEMKLYDGECRNCGHEFERQHTKPVKWGTRLSIRVTCPECGATVPLYLDGYEHDPAQDGPEWLVEEPDVRFDQGGQGQQAVCDGGEVDKTTCQLHRCADCERQFDGFVNGTTCPACGGPAECATSNGGHDDGEYTDQDVSRTQYVMEVLLILAFIATGLVVFWMVIQHGF